MAGLLTTLGLIGLGVGGVAIWGYLTEYQPMQSFLQQQGLWQKYLTFKETLEKEKTQRKEKKQKWQQN